jgi:hypothetical protein
MRNEVTSQQTKVGDLVKELRAINAPPEVIAEFERYEGQG